LVIEQSPALTANEHHRLRPGLNHLLSTQALPARSTPLTAEAPAHGWTLPFPETHPHAGGPDHYAAYLSNTDAFEVELVTTGGDQLVLP
jgi:hypothetical protein